MVPRDSHRESGVIMPKSDCPPSGRPPLPTLASYTSSTTKALILFKACLRGALFRVPRRHDDKVRAHSVM
ncbi:hypothetical protein F5Y13DRAFT_172258, partial [Hypoxylon sp. FL1857]